MPFEISDNCIIEEYLNNWFTYEELAQYLCISVDRIKSVVENKDLISKLYDVNKFYKISKHRLNIFNFYNNICGKEELTDIDKKVLEVAQYIIDNKCSVREAAMYFNIGKTTVHDYMNEKLPNISITLYKQVFDVFMNNKTFNTNNKVIINQVLSAYALLKEGYSSIEIQEKLGMSRNVLQRNLTTRLKKIDEDKYKEAVEILKQNQMAPLEEHAFKTKK